MTRYSKYLPWIIFLSSFLFVGLFTKTYLTSANEASRIATIIALEETGTFKLGRQYFSVKDDKSIDYSRDVIQRNGQFYAVNPPVFNWLSFLIRKLIPFSFPENPRDFSIAYYLLTLLTSGLSYSLLLVLFYKSLVLVKIKENIGLAITLLLGTATLLLPFATVFNNHLFAALILYAAFYCHLKNSESKNLKINALFIGFLITLLAVVEITIGIFFWIIYFIYLWVKGKNLIGHYFIGSLPWLILHAYFNWQITGDLLPTYLHCDLFTLSSTYCQGAITISGLLKSFYLITISPMVGLFFYTPVLIICCYGLLKIIKNKRSFYKEAAGLIICFTLSIINWLVFWTKYAPNYAAGCSFGLRYAMPYFPLLCFFLALYLQYYKPKGAYYYFIIFLITISIMISLVGLINPWTIPFNFGGKETFFPLLGNLILLKSYLF